MLDPHQEKPASPRRPAPSPAELEQVLQLHAAHVAHLHGGKRASLTLCNLKGAALAHRVLSGADLSGTVLEGADLSYAEFIASTLYCADLRSVRAQYCDFTHADLRGSILNGGNLSRAKLDYTDFRPGRLVEHSMDNATDRCGSAINADFSDCSLCGASFEGAHLEGANFSRAIIHATSFKRARLTNAIFKGAVLSQIRLEELDLPESVLKTCVLAPPVVESVAARHKLTAALDAHQRWIETDGRDGVRAVLDGEDLRPLSTLLGKYKLTAVAARRVIAVGMNFSGLEMQGAIFEEADLRGANFEGADLRGVRFRGAQLHHARLKNADLRSLYLRSGERLDVDFFRAEITDEQLAEARAS
jgi:uncharacterized protein YjbI with pentapeptide repeats